MPSRGSLNLVDIDIDPDRSPILAPLDSRPRGARGRSVDSFRGIPEEPDDIEFLAPGNWDEAGDYDEEDDEDSEEDSDEDSLEDFSLEDGHIEGVNSSKLRLNAKHYQNIEFASSLLTLLRDDLQIDGWSSLPYDVPATLLHIHKVSGSLTNAVFFVSIPPGKFDILDVAHRTPMLTSASLATFAAELERERAGATSTPRPGESSAKTSPRQRDVHVEAPTLLLRIYGPSSGSLISRKTELHILHTLSSEYAIGPKVLGTFTNGRVEEYFHSRALNPPEMRDARVSRWIGRRMRELHSVDLGKMEVPGGDDSDSQSSGRPERPSLDVGGRGSSGTSLYSTSSGSSVFSFGTSIYSTSSAGSTASLSTLGSEFGTPIVNSPLLMPTRGTSESRAASKRRSRSSMLPPRRPTKDAKLGVWENITRWTREAKLVLKELDQLAALPGFSAFADSKTQSLKDVRETTNHVVPLSSPSLTLALRAALNLPLFEQQVKLYRSFVRDWEKREGKSKRVFSHNDTQYGNLLLLTPDEAENEKELEKKLQAPHQKIIVVDFEYASANPRAFDIANHFIEWQADYHHETLSHSLFAHAPYPTSAERCRFLRSYVGVDNGIDGGVEVEQDGNRSPRGEDGRVVRLEDEVKIWEPSSHAMWTVWGIVQGKEDLLAKIAKWKKQCEAHNGIENGIKDLSLDEAAGAEATERPKVSRGKSGEAIGEDGQEEKEEVEPEADFDYLSYALCRMTLFREEIEALRVI